jgi:hypothetical protein
MNKIIVSFVFSLLFFGCTFAPASVPAELSKPFSIKVNQTALIDSEGLLIKLVEIPNDSRCPTDVMCVWAGEVSAKLELKKDTKEAFLQPVLGASADNRSEAEFVGYLVKLVSVEPYPKMAGSMLQSDYSVTLLVSKKS